MVSPSLDRRHGTERCIAEQLERFAKFPDTEIHLYAQRVEDLANVVRHPARATGCIVWHKVPRLPGPHLFGYIRWFLANHLQRWWDQKVRGLKFDLFYSPGINAFDADAISVHVIFTEFYRRVRPRLVRSIDAINLHRRLLLQPDLPAGEGHLPSAKLSYRDLCAFLRLPSEILWPQRRAC